MKWFAHSSYVQGDDRCIEFALDSKGLVRVTVWRRPFTGEDEPEFKALVPRDEFDALLGGDP